MVAPLIPVLAVSGFTGAAYLYHRYTRSSSSAVSGGNDTVRISGVSGGNYGAGGSTGAETQAPDWATLFKPVIDVLSTPLVLPTPATTQQTTSTNSATTTPATPAASTPASTPATTTPAPAPTPTATPATTTPALPAGRLQETPIAQTSTVESNRGNAVIGNLLFNPIAALFGGGGGKITTSAVFTSSSRPVAPAPSPVQGGAGVGRADVMNSGGMPETGTQQPRLMTLGFRPTTPQNNAYEAQPSSTPFSTQQGPQVQHTSLFDITGSGSTFTRRQRLVRT